MFSNKLDKVLRVMLVTGKKQKEILAFIDGISKRDMKNSSNAICEHDKSVDELLNDYDGDDPSLEYQVESSDDFLFISIKKKCDNVDENQIFNFYGELILISNCDLVDIADNIPMNLGSYATVRTVNYNGYLKSMNNRGSVCDDGIYVDRSDTLDFYLLRQDSNYYVITINWLTGEEEIVPINQVFVDDVLKPKKKVNIRRV